jgi:hypothetical protein
MGMTSVDPSRLPPNKPTELALTLTETNTPGTEYMGEIIISVTLVPRTIEEKEIVSLPLLTLRTFDKFLVFLMLGLFIGVSQLLPTLICCCRIPPLFSVGFVKVYNFCFVYSIRILNGSRKKRAKKSMTILRHFNFLTQHISKISPKSSPIHFRKLPDGLPVPIAGCSIKVRLIYYHQWFVYRRVGGRKLF